MKKLLALVCGFFMLTATTFAQKFAQEQLSIILDADIGSSTDDLFALDLLYKYMDEGKVNLLAIMLDREGDINAEITDVFNTWYGHGDIPIGVTHNSVKNPRVFIDYSIVATKTEKVNKEGKPDPKGKFERPYFARTVKDVTKLPESVNLYRKILAAQPDRSVVICAIGFLTNLGQLLSTGPDEYSPLTGTELVARKVKGMFTQGGVFYSSLEPDYNVLSDIENGRKVYEEWPTPIVFSPMEVGNAIDYPAKAVLADLSDYEKSPIKTVYEECFTNTGQRMWDNNTVINAVEGAGYYTISAPGNIHVTPQGNTIYTPTPFGERYYQITNRQQGLALYALIRERAIIAPKNMVVPE